MDEDRVPYNREAFAAYVKARPILWNPGTQGYKNLVLKQKALKEIKNKFVNVTVGFLKEEIRTVRRNRGQAKRRQKISGKSGAAGGNRVPNLANENWAFLDEAPSTSRRQCVSSIVVASAPERGAGDSARPEDDDMELYEDEDEDYDHGEGDGNGDGGESEMMNAEEEEYEDEDEGDDDDTRQDFLGQFLTSTLPNSSAQVLAPQNAVENCSAAAHEAFERLEEERLLRPPPGGGAAAPGLFVMSPRARRERGLDGGVAVPSTSGAPGLRPDEQGTPRTPRPVRTKRGVAPPRFSPSDYDSDRSDSASALQLSARSKKLRRRAIVPGDNTNVRLSVIAEAVDGEVPLTSAALADVWQPAEEEPGEQGLAAALPLTPGDGVRRDRGGESPPQRDDQRPNRSPAGRGAEGRGAGGRGAGGRGAGGRGAGGHGAGGRGAGGRGAGGRGAGGRGGQGARGALRGRGRVRRGPRESEESEDDEDGRQQNNDGQDEDGGLTAQQRLQRALEDRRLANRAVMEAQQQARDEAARRRQRNHRGRVGGGAGRFREELDPDDPRRLETSAEIALLREFLTDKEMDGFGHFGQSIACRLRAMRPLRSGMYMVRMLTMLNEEVESE